MFKVYWTNFGFFSQEEFASLDAARHYGEGKCFDFSVYQNGHMVGYWSVLSGWRAVNVW